MVYLEDIFVLTLYQEKIMLFGKFVLVIARFFKGISNQYFDWKHFDRTDTYTQYHHLTRLSYLFIMYILILRGSKKKRE